MTKYEILKCENAQELLNLCNLTVAQVRMNINADPTNWYIKNHFNVSTVKWFCKNVLLFNNFGKPVLR